ncbi:MAG: short-chain fatty acid transporter [Phycisphaerales bacterium]|nr:MAG: short-chain fatty acid transporter [Phycisphaerales bacterium]
MPQSLDASMPSSSPVPDAYCQVPFSPPSDPPGRLPAFLDRSPLVVWCVALPAFIWLALRFHERGLGALDLNSANLAFLALGLVLHNSASRYAAAIEDGARGCAGIILQFPLYAGILGMIRGSGLGAAVSGAFAGAAGGSEPLLRVMTFCSAGLVNLFVPSGGGQWAVQAPIALQAAADADADPGAIVMAVAYGDQWTNMLQPFWALPLLAITGVKARDIVGYTAIALVAGGAWMCLCLILL